MGRVPCEELPGSVRSAALQYIRPYHREIARRMVLGQSQGEICQALSMSPARMSIISRSPLFVLELQRLEKMRDDGVGDVTKTLHELSPLALECVERTMYGAKSERLRFDAAKDLLDRAGHGAVNKSQIQVSGNVAHYNSFTPEELKKMVMDRVQRMQDEAERKDEMIKEAESIEVVYEINDTPAECSMPEQTGEENKIKVMSV